MRRMVGFLFVLLVLAFAVPVFASGAVEVTDSTMDWIVFGAAVAGVVGLALTADANYPFELGDYNDILVAASTTIYAHAAVGDNGSGYARGLVAGDKFLGFATEQTDNSSGLDGAIRVHVLKRGVVKLPVGSFAITDVGKPVYASADGTFTLTATSNSFIGRAIRYDSSGYAYVAFDSGWAIADDEIQNAQIADDAVDSDQIAADAIDGSHIADDAIDSEHYTDGSIDTAHIAADAIDGTLLADDAVSLEHLDSGITPSHIVVFAGEFTTVGGDATETISQAGILDTDIVHCTLLQKGSSPETILSAVAIADAITVTMSGNPSTDHIISYSVLRAVS